jgi:lipid-binding SYLF domain-containing protein
MVRTWIAVLLAAPLLAGAQAPKEASRRVEEADRVFKEIMAAHDKGIPSDLLSDAHCIVIVPGMKHGGFVVGARYGKGVVLCRKSGGSGWTGPSTVRIEGGSFGLQIGGGEVDLVMLVMNDQGARKLMESKFTVGADATAAAGPVGRSAGADTDAYMHAKILSYSRSRGIFAGVVLDGATLRPDNDDNRILYGRTVSHKDILLGRVAPPPAASSLW